ncbi:uncharacterized protein LOC116928894 [Daphnia magna]|uniref:Uncharacterized protein n=2 Tax=Daphnia magna TaxID=35525 RepID=A0ABR0B2X3_9CRUS|nr:uncharacterized protein LOC116928894 [Daphnia magna]KAK4036042.1 hypothetical protein OUZ56_028113 [Daphnia magna]
MCSIRLLTLLASVLLASSNPIPPTIQQDDIFFFSLNSNEQSALMSMVVEAAGRVAAQRSEGSSMIEIEMHIPEIVIQRMREPNFNSQMLARWIGRRWDLSEQAIAELHLKGRGCSPRICLSVTSRSTLEDTCCPFG